MRYSHVAYATGLIAAAIAMPAHAGDTILYGEEDAWVDVANLPSAAEGQGLPLRLMESQTRMEDGVVASYGDIAFALDSTEALDAMGTITLEWLPDKGDLTVHRVELVRGDEVIDVLADGARFEVLRREEGLEKRILNGALTATMSIPGAQIGDVLRYSFTTTTDEQVLDDEMEYVNVVMAKPVPLAQGRMILSWPEDEDVRWATTRVDAPIEEATRDGYDYVTIALPAAEPTEIPADAPPRFRLPPQIRATTFDSYAQISADIAPYFTTAGTIEPGGTLADKVAEIAAQTADPRERAALATQFVQDEVSYLLNGLNGGNYIPQSPAETWALRSGDCKAKSLLLLAMLRELGIDAEAVLVPSQTGDALPEQLPTLTNFDHMIVRADIDGVPYWLDGTNGGLRATNMIEVPRFRYALPLREGGTDLQEMAMRPQAVPDQTVSIKIDQSAGVGLPAIYDVRIAITGATARQFQALSLIDDPAQKKDALYGTVSTILGDHQPVDMQLAFDSDSGIATVTAHGLVTSPWDTNATRAELDVPYQVADSFGFDVDRARPDIADLPVSVPGPIYFRREIEWLLPEGETQFRLLGNPQIDEVIGGTRLSSQTELTAPVLQITEEVQSLAWEFPASDLPDVRRASLRLKRSLPRLRATSPVRRAWEYRGDASARLEPIERIYTQLVADADSDDTSALLNRFNFRFQTGDFEGALADIDAAIARDASADNYLSRGEVHYNLGDFDAALADHVAVADIDPDYTINSRRIELLALLGRADEAVALVDEFAYLFEDPKSEAQLRSYALGFAGQAQEGLDLLRDELSIEPEDAGLLNSACWHAGIFDLVTEETLETCTRAVEEAQNSSGAIDSRALALYRMGRAEEALRDLDVALARSPGQHSSRYLRGVVKRSLGREVDAREDIESALHAAPGIASLYSLWGLPPK